MASFQAALAIEYFSLDNIGERVFMNTIASIILFATSTVAYWCLGMCSSPLPLGCGTFGSPLDISSGSAWTGRAQSDSDNLLRRVDFWHLIRGGAIARAGIQRICKRRACNDSISTAPVLWQWSTCSSE